MTTVHIAFISAINIRFKGSGLADILVATGVIVEGSIDRVLLGKEMCQMSLADV